MWTGQLWNMKTIKDSGHVKGAAVERCQQVNIVKQIQKTVQVFVLYKRMQLIIMPADNDGDGVVVFQSSGFDIKERCPVKILMQHPPFVLRTQISNEVLNVIVCQCLQTTF